MKMLNKQEERLREMPACWEVEHCPQEVRSACPAWPEHGRSCWKLTGTKCASGKIEKSSLAEKILHCRSECGYYREYISTIYP